MSKTGYGPLRVGINPSGWTPEVTEAYNALVDHRDLEHAPCRQDPELWWSLESGEIMLAKRLCKSCPIIKQCLNFAVMSKEREGVWGGTSSNERSEIFKKEWREKRAAAERAARSSKPRVTRAKS